MSTIPQPLNGLPSLAALTHERIKATPDTEAFRIRRGNAYVALTWRDVAPRLEAIAAGLLTAKVKLAPGEKITLMGNAGMDWILCDFAGLSVSLSTVPVYASLLPPEVAFMHADTGARLVVVDDKAQLDKLREIQGGTTFRDRTISKDDIKVEHVVVINPAGLDPADDWESLADLEARGKAALADTADERKKRRETPVRDELATLTYTSGTTGVPKGVMQTHGNMLAMLESSAAIDIFPPAVCANGFFLFLPPAHSFGRLVELAGPFFGAPLVISSVKTLVEDLGLSRPGFFPSAPRVFEKMMAKIEGAVEQAPAVRQALFKWALSVGEQTIDARSRGQKPPLPVRVQRRVARKLVWVKLQARLGLDRAGLLLSGSAPLSPAVHKFFLSIGLDLVEAYGLTETCPGLTTNHPQRFRLATVGQAFPGVTLRIAEDGEIQARGPNITSGYLNRPDATAEAFADDGWFMTGDLGALDADGFLRITGRKKELIKTSGGKYVAPAKIEERIKRHRLVQEAVVIGDGHNYCVCLISLDDEELADWAQHEGHKDPVAAAEPVIRAHIEEVNKDLASFETMKDFRFTGEMLSVENQMLTASLKVRRKPVAERYAALIDEMYKRK